MTSEKKGSRRFQSVLYISNEFQLYVGQLVLANSTAASLPELLAVSLEGEIKMTFVDAADLCLSSVFSHQGFQRKVDLNGVYAYLILSPGNRYSYILQDSMRKIADGLYSDIDNLDHFRDVFQSILLTKPSIEEVKRRLDKLIINDNHRFYVGRSIDERAKQVIDIINEQPMNNFSVEEFAEKVHLSPSRLMGMFKKETKMTLGQYSAFRKLIYAYYLIAQGISLANAASLSGFYDDSHLAKTSRKFLGILPSLLFSSEIEAQVIGTQEF